jgi:hypothetical protein
LTVNILFNPGSRKNSKIVQDFSFSGRHARLSLFADRF